MKRTILALAILAMLTSCASSSLPQQIPETLNAACQLYTSSKPDVIAAREWAKANWNLVPEELKPTLLKLDAYLPALDEAGLAICAGAEGIKLLSGKRIDWDDCLSTVLKITSFALELKARGAIQ